MQRALGRIFRAGGQLRDTEVARWQGLTLVHTHTHSLSLSHTVILTAGRHTQTFPISNLSLSNLIFIILSLALSLSLLNASQLSFLNSLSSQPSFYLLFPFLFSLSPSLFLSSLSASLTKAAGSMPPLKMRPRTASMQMKAVLLD